MPTFIQQQLNSNNRPSTKTSPPQSHSQVRIWALVTLLVTSLIGGCTNKSGDPNNPTLTVRQTQQWSQSCALCHISGVGGAPVVGDTSQWQLRLAKGEEQLLTHTLEGYANMPPLGYCMSCETEDFRAMIAWMARSNP